jgi:hypothetical protein
VGKLARICSKEGCGATTLLVPPVPVRAAAMIPRKLCGFCDWYCG